MTITMPRARAPDRRERSGWSCAAALVLLLSLGRLWWLPARASLNLNEGWNAGQAVRAFGTASLYPASDALVQNNYPPLSFVVVGAIGRLLGDDIVAGRIVSLIAEIACGAAVYVMVARLTGDRRWARAGALLFAGFAVTLLRPYLAMNDPQWMGHAIQAGGLLLLLPRAADGRLVAWRVASAAGLMVAGGLVKHNLVGVPLAATLWLALVDRRALRVWIAAGLGCAAAACLVLLAIWGPVVFVDILMPARSYWLLRMAAKGMPLLLALLPALLASRPLLRAWHDDRRLALPAIMFAVAIPIAVVQRSGASINVNALFDTMVALAVAVPAACAQRRERPAAWLGIAALPAVCLVPTAAIADLRELAGRDAAVRRVAPFIAAIGAARGPVACDDQSICYWAGRQSGIDFFAMKERLAAGRSDGLHPALARGDFALIAMRSTNPGWNDNPLIPVIRAYYRPAYVADGSELLVKRR